VLALSALILAFATSGAPVYRPPRPATPAQAPAAGPDETLSDEELRSRVTSYLGAIDVPVTTEQWRALGPRAAPLLEAVLANTDDLPSRRASAVGGLAVIGGKRARTLVLKTAQSEAEPFAVRAAALHGAPRVLGPSELVRQLKPVLQGAREPATRAAAADVLARYAPRSACSAIRAQAEREGEARAHFERALQRCGGMP
jgi:HEAT repeat protein